MRGHASDIQKLGGHRALCVCLPVLLRARTGLHLPVTETSGNPVSNKAAPHEAEKQMLPLSQFPNQKRPRGSGWCARLTAGCASPVHEPGTKAPGGQDSWKCEMNAACVAVKGSSCLRGRLTMHTHTLGSTQLSITYFTTDVEVSVCRVNDSITVDRGNVSLNNLQL